ncbi:40S ribosomal protein [Ceratobasidium sp. 414]|nr:40S ribosomal protein [Ceratobasidium sp. 414]
MPGNSNDDNTPLFMRTLLANVPAHLLEVPTGKLPAEVPQSLIDTLADQSKSEGDRLYRENKWQEARDAYMSGIGLRTSDPNVRKAILLNLAATDLQLKEWNAVLRDTSWVLKVDPNSVKGLYRCFVEALDCCDRALKIEPHNQLLREERRTARKEVIKLHQQLLSEAYKYHHLLVVPSSADIFSGPTPQSSLLPYFDPPTPADPINATLFCNLNITYAERCSADYVGDFPFNKPILPLLNTLFPSSLPLGDTSPAQHNLVPIPNPLSSIPSQDLDIKHPTTWDPKYEFLPSSLSVYASTRRAEIICVTGEMTLVDVCAKAKQMSPDPPDQEDAYRQDGEYIEIREGMITLFGFRKGSKAEERFRGKDFQSLVDLVDPGYVVPVSEAVLTDSRLRNFNYGPPNRPINDPSSLSFAARQGMLRFICGN